MSLPVMFSMIFFTAFVIYVFTGLYIRSLNNTSAPHNVFFAACLALSIWSFAYSICNSAPDLETALFWRRVATLGWATILSLLLHCVLLLTDKMQLLRKKWIWVLLYLPSVVLVAGMGLSPGIAAQQYNLIYSSMGWVNLPSNSFWYCLWYGYYGIVLAIILGVLWHRGWTTNERDKRKQAYIIAASSIAAILLGILAQILISGSYPIITPQLTPVVFLIPISTLLYCIRVYGLMAPNSKSRVAREGEILSEANRSRLYQYFSYAYILGAALNLAVSYLILRGPFDKVFLYSGMIFLGGFTLKIVDSLRISSRLKDAVAMLIITLSVPFIITEYIDSAGITVWGVPFVFIMITVLFRQRRMMVMIGLITVCTLAYVWVKMPIGLVQVDGSDHIFRLFIFFIFMWMAFYVNRVYIRRLSDNDQQIKFQKMISRISTDFVTVSESNLDEKINSMFRQCGEYFKADRVRLLLFALDQKTLTNTFEWCAENVEPVGFEIIEAGPRPRFPQWNEPHRRNNSVHIPNVDKLENDHSEIRKFLKDRRIKSIIAIPVYNKDIIIGYFCFDLINTYRYWRKDQQEILQVLGHLLADALGKVEIEREINNMAFYDPLTGLPNRALLSNRLHQAIELAKRSQKLVGVIFVDVDSFKFVNDTLGHEAGDDLLVEMAARLGGCVRRYDTVARFGGDEFIIMVPQMSKLEDISRVAEKVMQAFQDPLTVKNHEFFVTASAGIAVFPMDGDEVEDLIKNADLAMYVSKDKGKNRYTLCSPEMKREVLVNMELTNRLYRAQERNELRLYYQPIVSAVTGKITGVEALIRWHHPDKGVIPPEMFIPLAEKIGLINPIGQWVLETACSKAKEWQDKGLPPIKMSVNMSLGQFRNPRMVENLRAVLQETHLDPGCLELEITEGLAAIEPEYIFNILTGLKELGVTISIDDFGTYYSSFSRLKNMPIDRIKIDLEFVHGISRGLKEEGILKVILKLGRTLGLKVTAEGVETREQLEFLKENQCDAIQGFYFYKPMLAEEIEDILRR